MIEKRIQDTCCNFCPLNVVYTTKLQVCMWCLHGPNLLHLFFFGNIGSLTMFLDFHQTFAIGYKWKLESLVATKEEDYYNVAANEQVSIVSLPLFQPMPLLLVSQPWWSPLFRAPQVILLLLHQCAMVSTRRRMHWKTWSKGQTLDAKIGHSCFFLPLGFRKMKGTIVAYPKTMAWVSPTTRVLGVGKGTQVWDQYRVHNEAGTSPPTIHVFCMEAILLMLSMATTLIKKYNEINFRKQHH